MVQKVLFTALFPILIIIVIGVFLRLDSGENSLDTTQTEEYPSQKRSSVFPCENFESLFNETARAYTRISKKTPIPWQGEDFFVSYQGNIPMFLVVIKASSWKEYNRILPSTADFFTERDENPCQLYIVWAADKILGPSNEPIIGIPCFIKPGKP